MTAPHQSLLGISGAVDTEVTDPNFNQTVLLLHGDGTNGGQNNTFTDSSSNNASMTRNGNIPQGTFNPFLGDGQYSNFFDADADYLTIASSSDFVMGSGDFTIEFFAYFLDAGQGGFATVESTGGMAFYYTGTYFTLSARGSSQPEYVKYTHTPTLNTWHHIAVCRSGTGSNETALFFNGSRVAQSTNNTNYTVQADLHIGDINAVAGYDFNGYISNLRIVKGSSVYDTSSSSITVPTAALTAVTNTKLLTCQSNRFIDNSTSGHTISTSGTPKVLPFSPFAPTASYSESVHGGSGFFDGTGDYLMTASNLSTELTFGTGDFDLSVWLYPTISTGSRGVYEGRPGGNGNYPFMRLDSLTPKYGVDFANTGGGAITVDGSTACQLNAWNFVTWSRVSGTTRIFLNGTQVGSASDTRALLSPGTGNYPYIGAGYEPGDYFTGYMCNYRVRKGVGVTSQTVPTAPLTSDSDTQLLLDFTNASIIDSSMENNIETVADAHVDTSVKKFGTGSIQFDSVGDELKMINSPSQQPRTGEFTIEFFVYFSGTGNHGFFGNSTSGYYGQLFGGNFQFVQGATANINIAWSYSTGQWYHVAIARDSSNNTRLFIDGTQLGSTATSNTLDYNHASIDLSIGDIGGGYGRRLYGYIDEFRLTKGVARYTSNFTAPTKAFPDK